MQPAPSLSKLLDKDALNEFWWPQLRHAGAPPVFRGGFEYTCRTGLLEVQQCLRSDDSITHKHTLSKVADWHKSGLEKCWLEIDEAPEHRRLSYFFSTEDWSKLETLVPAVSSLPDWVSQHGLDFLGWMPERPGAPLKLVLAPQKDELGALLCQLDWCGDIALVERTQRRFLSGKTFRLSLDLFGSKLGPSLGLEVLEPEGLSENFQAEGLLTTNDSNVVDRWTSLVTPSGWNWPIPALPSNLQNLKALPIFRRSLSHYKLIFKGHSEPELKVYLFFSLGHLTEGDLEEEDLFSTERRARASLSPNGTELLKLEPYLNGQIPSETLSYRDRSRAFELAWWMMFIRKQGRPL